MRILVTGACGFAGSTIIGSLLRSVEGLEVIGLDNLSRPGSEGNVVTLQDSGVRFVRGDIRNWNDLDGLDDVNWIIDAAANPSVLAGLESPSASRNLLEHNLLGTMNVLELCKKHSAGLLLLSTSRVYSVQEAVNIPLVEAGDAFRPDIASALPGTVSMEGVTEFFPSTPPLSLYGATKMASEVLALEYGETFSFPVWINRCGVLAGAGQFGRPDQGIFSYWIHSYCQRAPLRYIGFKGTGYQVRDCLHPADLASLFVKQMASPVKPVEDRIINVSGGYASSMSLRELTNWCRERFGAHEVSSDLNERPFDIPWMVLDSHKAAHLWDWTPTVERESILEEIARHAEQNPNWLKMSNP